LDGDFSVLHKEFELAAEFLAVCAKKGVPAEYAGQVLGIRRQDQVALLQGDGSSRARRLRRRAMERVLSSSAAATGFPDATIISAVKGVVSVDHDAQAAAAACSRLRDEVADARAHNAALMAQVKALEEEREKSAQVLIDAEQALDDEKMACDAATLANENAATWKLKTEFLRNEVQKEKLVAEQAVSQAKAARQEIADLASSLAKEKMVAERAAIELKMARLEVKGLESAVAEEELASSEAAREMGTMVQQAKTLASLLAKEVHYAEEAVQSEADPLCLQRRMCGCCRSNIGNRLATARSTASHIREEWVLAMALAREGVDVVAAQVAQSSSVGRAVAPPEFQAGAHPASNAKRK
jgi:hypothetical protein